MPPLPNPIPSLSKAIGSTAAAYVFTLSMLMGLCMATVQLS